MRIRISDIAEELGLSTATVSNVIHGKTAKVSEATNRQVCTCLCAAFKRSIPSCKASWSAALYRIKMDFTCSKGKDRWDRCRSAAASICTFFFIK